MRKSFLLLILLLLSSISFSQTPLWSEGFQNGCTADCSASSYSGTNGPWTLTLTGVNGADPNIWYVSGAECGNSAGVCGTVCGATDPSLHIGSNATVLGDQGASYLAGGLGFWFPQTDSRIESPTIDMTGQSTLTLSFNYIENGDLTNDNATLWYFDGAIWSLLTDLAKTPLTCNPQGTWTAFSVALPASANNNALMKIGFRWVNNDDNVGTDPSIAIDDIQITTPSASAPVADFSTPSTTICEGECITFTNTSTFVAGATFSWNFGNGDVSSSQTPPAICYNNSGSFTVTLTVTDANGTDTETKLNYIVVNPTLTAGADNSSNICNNTSINLTTLLSGADSGGAWTETTIPPSGQFTAATGVFDASGLTPGVYTFQYEVTGTTPCPDDSSTMTITVNPCTGPIADISASSLTVCEGQSITFNDNSTGVNIDTWVWSFGGGLPGTANTAGPHSITFNTSGTFNIWLQVSDDNGTDDETIQITVIPCSAPTAAFAISDNTICPGDCITYDNNTSTVGATTYAWTFEGGSPASSTSSNPGFVCYAASGTYTTTLVATNAFGFSSYSQTINVVTLPTVTAYGDTILEMGSTAVIGASTSDGDLSWTWTPNNQGIILDCIASDCSTAEVSPVITTSFVVTTTTSEGCQVSDYVTILVDFDANIGVPSMFSPDDNDQNDILYVKGLGIADMIFRVYNRYGQLVFESTDQSVGWDGKFKGIMENPATFVYTLDYTLVDGTVDKMNGNITLVR